MAVPAAREMMVSRERYVALVAAIEAAEDGVCVTNPDGVVHYCNAPWRWLLDAEADRRALEAAIADARRSAVVRSGAHDGNSAAARTAAPGVLEIRGASRAETQIVAAPSLTLHVRTATAEYRVRGTAARGNRGPPSEIMVVLWVRRCRPRHLTAEALRKRYGLTPREARVAALIAARSGTRQIAEVLGISPHTVRRHAEAVLRKLGVRSRAEVGERLRE